MNNNKYHGVNLLLHPTVQQFVNQSTGESFNKPNRKEDWQEKQGNEHENERNGQKRQEKKGQDDQDDPEQATEEQELERMEHRRQAIDMREEILNNMGRCPERIQEQLRTLKKHAKEKREFVQAISVLKSKHEKLTKEIQMLSDEHFILDFSSAQIEEQVKIAKVNVNTLKRKIKRLKTTKESLATERLKLEREQRRLEREGEQLQSNNKRRKLNNQQIKEQQQQKEQTEKQMGQEELEEKHHQLEMRLLFMKQTTYIETLFELTRWVLLKRRDQSPPGEYFDFDIEHREYAEQVWNRQKVGSVSNTDMIEEFRKRFFFFFLKKFTLSLTPR